MLKPWFNGSRMLPPWLALALLLGIQLASLPFLLKIHFNNAGDIYSPPGAPIIQLRESLFREFPGDEALIALFEGDALYTPEFLAALHRVAETMQAHPSVDRVLTLTTVEHIDATDDGFAVSLLIDPNELDARTPAQWQARVQGDTFAPGLLASPDGRAVALVVRPRIPKESLARRDIQIALDAAIAAEKLDTLHSATAGSVAQTVEELRSIWRDSAIFIPLTVVIGLALMWWVVGRVRPMVVGGLAMGTVVSASVAGLVISGQPYTPITAMIPTLMAAYTTATLLHLYAAIQRERIALLPRPRRIARAVRNLQARAVQCADHRRRAAEPAVGGHSAGAGLRPVGRDRHADGVPGGVHPGAADPAEMGHPALAAPRLGAGARASRRCGGGRVQPAQREGGAGWHRPRRAGDHSAGDAGQGGVEPDRVFRTGPQHQPQYRPRGRRAIRRDRARNHPHRRRPGQSQGPGQAGADQGAANLGGNSCRKSTAVFRWSTCWRK